jgi:4-hydroxybenzoate polyprenyltransferase
VSRKEVVYGDVEVRAAEPRRHVRERHGKQEQLAIEEVSEMSNGEAMEQQAPSTLRYGDGGGRIKESIKAYIDLTRAHFWFAWPLLFCSGLVLAFDNYGGFSWSLILRAALIAVLGFEAGFVLNDYVDRDVDKKDIEFDKLTRYWRPFRKRPIPSGSVSPRRALGLFFLLVFLTSLLIATLPYPNSLYVFVLMVFSYCMEYFYQVRKRNQTFPFSQLLGRLDFALFPVAGYLCYGHPDATALRYFLFFYPWVIAHLGVNDLIDVKNDESRDLKTVAVLYGMKGTQNWILLFTVMHFVVAPLFLVQLGAIAVIGFILAFLLLAVANYLLIRDKSPEAGLKVLPIFHLTMMIYAISIILDYAF